MAFHSENSMSGMGHVAHQPCLYSAVNPYPYCSVAPNQNLYTTESGNLQIYAKQLMMQRLATASVYGQTLYPQRSPAIGSNSSNDLYMFPSVATTLNAGYQQTYGSKVQSSPMTTDYTRILDASNQLKCPKPAHPFYWRKRGNSVPAEGMTRTKDKYRVVYTDKQRVGLEKEFKINKFITMQRKTELSKELDLSERQIKIWFQNRRAKERRQRRKTETSEDHVINELPETVDELPENTGNEKAATNDELFDIDITSHNYPILQTLEEPTKRNQCRFEQNSERICETGTISTSQQRLPTSPSEWSQASALMTSCNVSPFTANPDWNLIYRS